MTRVGRIMRRILRAAEPPSEQPAEEQRVEQQVEPVTAQSEATEWASWASWASQQWQAVARGYDSNFEWRKTPKDATPCGDANDLRQFFDNRKEGPGIWKWNHYFDIYDRHLRRFRGQEVHVLEIGVYSGGSLEMWREYFGPKARIYGVDIEPACRAYESDSVKIFIGDQANRTFWQEFRQQVPALDVVIDDGGHQPEEQIASVEELLPILRPGGVYLCEDVHWASNKFASYVHGMGHRLNDFRSNTLNADDDERRIVYDCTPFQAAVASIHLYPFVTVIERTASDRVELRAPKRGSQWEPFKWEPLLR